MTTVTNSAIATQSLKGIEGGIFYEGNDTGRIADFENGRIGLGGGS